MRTRTVIAAVLLAVLATFGGISLTSGGSAGAAPPPSPTTIAYPLPSWWSTATTVTILTTQGTFCCTTMTVTPSQVELLPEGVSFNDGRLFPWSSVAEISKAS